MISSERWFLTAPYRLNRVSRSRLSLSRGGSDRVRPICGKHKIFWLGTSGCLLRFGKQYPSNIAMRRPSHILDTPTSRKGCTITFSTNANITITFPVFLQNQLINATLTPLPNLNTLMLPVSRSFLTTDISKHLTLLLVIPLILRELQKVHRPDHFSPAIERSGHTYLN
jgi:hypothetical protein